MSIAKLRDLLEKNNSLDLMTKNKLGAYEKLITYTDAEKAIQEILLEQYLRIETIFSYDDKDEDDKISELQAFINVQKGELL
jgi:hypothetical protein